MRKYLIATLALLVFAGVGMAKEYVLEADSAPDTGLAIQYVPVAPTSGGLRYLPPPPGETELYWDDGVDCGSYFSSSYSPYATTFTAPSACHLVTYRLYWYGGGSVNINCLLYNDSGGTPTGSTLFTVTGNSGSASFAWVDIPVSSAGATLTSGQVFHPGWSHTSGSAGVLMDNPKHAGSCWLWLGYWYDYSPYYTHMVRVVIDDDATGPYVDGQAPADGGWTNDNTQLVFHAKDDDKGVDDTTIDVSVDDGSRADVPGSLDITGTPADYACTFYPDSPFDDGTFDVTVPGSLADLLGNEMGDDEVWSFSVDTTVPTVGGRDPADGASGVDPDTNIVFHVYDPGVGVDTGTIDFTVQDTSLSPGNHAVSAGSSAVHTGYAPAGDISGSLDIDDADPGDVICTFDPTDPLPPDTITCTVAAGLADTLGNATTDDIVWSFNITGEGSEVTTWGLIKVEF
ncbi:MAG: Ig-like domain-containing protein [bacterium]|nr:Ig-like domain-containing protein [bacterium]